MKTKWIWIICILIGLCNFQISAQEDRKLLVGLEYAGIGMSLSKNNESRKGPFDMLGLNLQYNFDKRYSLLFGYARRKIGGFGLDAKFDQMDVSAFLKNEYFIGEKIKINPDFNVFSIGISLPTLRCQCIHQTLNYDFLWRKEAELPASVTEGSVAHQRLYKNIISGLRYSLQLKIAFPENNFRIYLGPTISWLGIPKFQKLSETDFRMGANMGGQYLLKK